MTTLISKSTPTRRRSAAQQTTSSSLAAVPLYPYQRRWIEDGSRFKLAVKATQVGFSYAAALEAVMDCVERETMWIVLSRGERQSLEFMQKVRQHVRALKVLDSSMESSFFEQTNESTLMPLRSTLVWACWLLTGSTPIRNISWPFAIS